MVISDAGRGELVATFVAALARDDPHPAKVVEYGAEEANGKALSFSQLFGGERLAWSGCQGAQRPQRVLDSG